MGGGCCGGGLGGARAPVEGRGAAHSQHFLFAPSILTSNIGAVGGWGGQRPPATAAEGDWSKQPPRREETAPARRAKLSTAAPLFPSCGTAAAGIAAPSTPSAAPQAAEQLRRTVPRLRKRPPPPRGKRGGEMPSEDGGSRGDRGGPDAGGFFLSAKIFLVP